MGDGPPEFRAAPVAGKPAAVDPVQVEPKESREDPSAAGGAVVDGDLLGMVDQDVECQVDDPWEDCAALRGGADEQRGCLYAPVPNGLQKHKD